MKKSITSLDLNLLLCLQLLMQERSVTKAAKRMNVTPSAVSKSLSKLRTWFDDPLFVNTPLGLTPTPLMVNMEQSPADWMQMSNQLLDKPHHESPRGLKFELAAESPLVMIMFNSLSQQIYQRYPQATIKVRNWDYDSLDAITRGEVDLGFTGRRAIPVRGSFSACCRCLSILKSCSATSLGLAAGRSPGATRRVESGNIFTLSAYQHLLGAKRHRALDDVLQEIAANATSP